MNQGILFAGLLVLAAYVAAVPSSCPPVPCPRILHPPSCRTVTFFLHNNDQVCQGCDECIEESEHLDEKGCPLRACTLQLIADECRRERYFVYRGRTICQDCPQDIC